VSSILAVVEVSRAAARGRADPASVLDALARIDIDEVILDAASTMKPPELSILDAVHLASALAHQGSRRNVRLLRRAARSSGSRCRSPRQCPELIDGPLAAHDRGRRVGSDLRAELEEAFGLYERKGKPRHDAASGYLSTVRTTFPVFCSVSTYLVASTTSSSG
jgi:hypothetical protein